MNFASIDLFSSQFSFNIRGTSIQKGTKVGSFFTIVVLCLTVAYLCYVLVQYFENQIEPTYRAQSIINNSTQQIDIVKNVFAYRIDLPGAEKDLVYTSLKVMANYQNETQQRQLQMPTTQCLDSNLNGYLCFDIDQFYKQYSILDVFNKQYNYQLTLLSLITESCNDDTQQSALNCASQQDIDSVMNSAYITLKLQVSLYDTLNKKLKYSYQTTKIYTSSDQYKTTTIRLQNQQITVKDGLFIQSPQSLTSAYNYVLENSNLNRQTYIQSFGSCPNIYKSTQDVKKQIDIQNLLQSYEVKKKEQQIKQNQKDNQNIKIEQQKNQKMQIEDQVIVQNQEIYQNKLQQQNSKGAISSVLNDSNLNEQNDDHPNNLQNYQLQINSLNKFDENQGKSIGPKIKQQYQESISSNGTPKLNQQYISQQTHHNPIKICISDSRSTENQNNLKENIIENQPLTQNQIGEIKINLEAQKKLKDQKLSAFVQKIIFGFKVFKKNEYLKSKGFDNEKKKKIYDQIYKDLDITQFYQDIIFIKKTIMILLSQDQLAVLQLIGCSSNMLRQDLQNLSDEELQSINNQNYFEEQLLIYQSDELKNRHIQSFMTRCSNVENQSDVDNRILKSISKTYFD
ncbi:hypothetical protein ABPG74_004162 [Tetrahymena malaccensis]